MVDLLTGLYSAISIQAALHEGKGPGQGQKIDMSLMDTAVSLSRQCSQQLSYFRKRSTKNW